MKPRTAAQKSLPLGTRVRLNEAGKKLNSVLPNRSGVVEGYTRDGDSAYVRWDGYRATQAWFCHLLTVDPR
ncbi:MAG: hypothetical protein ACRDHF_00545 [Tepidiformaceae bacterium]